jgi:SAM-dependent methyltransferase
VPRSAAVLDLGAGTGKLTSLLVDVFDPVLALEPAAEMLRVLAARSPAARALAGSAEEIPLADGSLDGVFAAESFHWFDGDRALAEIVRVLRLRGALVMLWNLPAGPTEPSIAEAERFLRERAPAGLAYDPLDLNADRYASGQWRLAFGGSEFGELRETRLSNPQRLDADGLVAFFASMGWVGDLPDADRLPLLDELRSLLPAAEYTRPWETHVSWTRLR